jgi:hypothetical protein
MTIADFSAKPVLRARKTARAEGAERRRSERMSLSLAAELIETQAGARISGRMSDCCMFGCFVDTINTFPDRTPVRVRVRKSGEIFEAEAVVAYSQMRLGMGLAFTYIPQEGRRMLESWIARGAEQTIHGMSLAAPEHEHRALVNQTKRFEKLVRLLSEKGVLNEAEAREFIDNIIL